MIPMKTQNSDRSKFDDKKPYLDSVSSKMNFSQNLDNQKEAIYGKGSLISKFKPADIEQVNSGPEKSLNNFDDRKQIYGSLPSKRQVPIVLKPS